MTSAAADAELVQAHLTGDPGALATIYDRYAASLYDTAASLLRDRDEAADAVQDTFVAAAGHLGQLRDPARLRAWLFAILRHEVERRGRRRSRVVPAPEVGDVAAPDAPDPGAQLEGVELGALVRDAAAGLDERDQLVLELSLRQRLEGADLAAALGVSAEQSYSLVFRMRERVSRSLMALVVARSGRRDCDELAAILQGWDGHFSVLIRKRVARHVDRCSVCERTKARAALPGLFGIAPAFALPVGLRDRVLAQVDRGADVELAVDSDGFPVPTRRWRTAVLVAVAAVVAVVVLGAGTIALAQRGSDGPVVVAAPVPATTAAASPPTAAAPTTVAPTTVTTAVPTTTLPPTVPTTTAPPPPPSVTPAPPAPPSPPPSPPPAPPRLVLSASQLSFGATRSSASFELRNPGGSPLAWSIASVTAPFVGGGSGVVPAGGRQAVTVTLDRTGLAEGALAGIVRISSGAGQGVVQLAASVEVPPVVRAITFAAAPIRVGGSAPRATTVTISASDPSGVTVVAQLRGPDGRTGTLGLTATGATQWRGPVGPFAVAGLATVEVTATDGRGNTTTASRALPVVACP